MAGEQQQLGPDIEHKLNRRHVVKLLSDRSLLVQLHTAHKSVIMGQEIIISHWRGDAVAAAPPTIGPAETPVKSQIYVPCLDFLR